MILGLHVRLLKKIKEKNKNKKKEKKILYLVN